MDKETRKQGDKEARSGSFQRKLRPDEGRGKKKFVHALGLEGGAQSLIARRKWVLNTR